MNYINKIKVSIILPVYNVEPFIRKCLDSLINQTLKEIEIILVDDCSTDKSGIICDEYATIDNRITVIHNEKNIRQGLSRNKGINVSRGEYLAFVDPDDWVDLDYYEFLYETACKNNSDIVKSERIKVLPNGDRISQKKLNKEILTGLKNNKPIFLLFNYEHTTAIFKKEVIIKHDIRYPDIRNSQDVVFLLMATYFSNSISIISKTYYYYRQHPNSTISVKEKPYFDSVLEYFRLYIDFINTHKMERDHYNLVFARGFYSVKNRFKEIEQTHNLENYKREYVKIAFDTMLNYKYDMGHILDSFVLKSSNLERVLRSISNKTKRLLQKAKGL